MWSYFSDSDRFKNFQSLSKFNIGSKITGPNHSRFLPKQISLVSDSCHTVGLKVWSWNTVYQSISCVLNRWAETQLIACPGLHFFIESLSWWSGSTQIWYDWLESQMLHRYFRFLFFLSFLFSFFFSFFLNFFIYFLF